MEQTQSFEQIIAEHKDLNALFNRKEISVFSSFKGLDLSKKDFLDWLSPKYYEVFMEIYNENIGTDKEGKIVALLNAPRLCNISTEDKIAEQFENSLATDLTRLKSLSSALDHGKEEFLTQVPVIDKVLNYVNLAVFKNLKRPKIVALKEEITTVCLDMCDRLKHYKPKHNYTEFAVYNMIINNLKKIPLQGELHERIHNHGKKLNQKHSSNTFWYYAGTALVVLLIIVRIMVRMNR